MLEPDFRAELNRRRRYAEVSHLRIAPTPKSKHHPILQDLVLHPFIGANGRPIRVIQCQPGC